MEDSPEPAAVTERAAACSPNSFLLREAVGEPDLEQTLERYHRSLRDRASKSLNQLKQALDEKDMAIGEGTAVFDQLCNNIGYEESEERTWQELQYSHAVNQLKALLRQQEEKESEMSPSRRRRMSPTRTAKAADQSLPALCDLVPIVHDQSQYINHLEAEVKFCKEEMSELKSRIHVVVLENEKLHDDLKMLTVECTLRGQTLLDTSATPQNACGAYSHVGEAGKSSSHKNEQAAVATLEIDKWQLELDKLKCLHQERTEALEAQVQSLRKQLAESQKNCEELTGRLRHQDMLSTASSSNRAGGLCLKCAQHEAVLSQTHSNVHMQTIERLTKEKEELLAALSSLRINLSEMQRRECSAYEQVKQAVHMTEEANLERTKAFVQCEQLKNEMERQRNRLERELGIQLDKRAQEREAVREEMKKEKENLSSMVMSLSQNVASLEAQVDRITREKISLASQLEEAHNQNASHEMEINKVCGEIRYQLNQTKMKKDEVEKEHREYRTKTMRELEIKDQEIVKLQAEFNQNKQRLEQAHQDIAGAKDECLKLTELLGKAEHQLHLTRLEKENIQHSFSKEAKTRALQAQQREQELTQKMQQMEAQHDKTVNELDALLRSQNVLLSKLKEECCTLAKKLEYITEKSRSEIGQLSQENEYIHDRLERMQKRNGELEVQCVQHGKMHEKMKLRLHQLDKHCQTTAQQLVELLNKQNELYKERQALKEEVDFLQTQLPHESQPL
ncbi:serologically defined colon cancer antigen 8 [Sceloporus undulatus]|uniref:serologically defined colon cancer antigen 8 n=1 Tax=Sceloporus undulatus TaxID=8520 RepID=UPI001C4B33BB|nr:serologically defined colon cancer antigen 8 [Sceloporus undulatus]XP_042302843.1 serologically defined colon cancer antigen 8 [Sceloporus undulatus]XP_042302844.1 serologically defined colon cancer antigen 8 [Sceloporus undulatus]XP_042302845.1 serologically defined colon cancer antigen 8 [Sceloporus undulatus]XP_042302846.1 serologically defined colon cancer antigen 8 [Sceloporus undulatus]